jgi:hypothetical protein
MNELRPGVNLSYVSVVQQRDVVEQNPASEKMRIDFAFFLKMVAAMDAAAQQDLESAGESVLVDAGGTVEPKINVNIESRSNVDGEGRITEVRFEVHLLWQIGSCLSPTNDVPRIDAIAQIQIKESLRGNDGKLIFVVVLVAPAPFHERAKIGEWFHENLFRLTTSGKL